MDDLARLFGLYFRPRAAMAAIVDEGSLLFGVVAVLLVSVLSQVPAGVTLWDAATKTAAAQPRTPEADAEAGDVETAPSSRVFMPMLAAGSVFSIALSVAGLALLYVPAVILLMTFFDRRAGSFGVALPRDYGMLAPCALFSWAAAHLLFALVALGLAAGRPELAGGFTGFALVWLGGGIYFVLLMTLAVRLVYGVSFGRGLAPVVLGAFALPFAGYLTMLASPFVLYWAFIYLRGDISAIQGQMGSRRSFRRHLEAATLNPRDSEAHYQLGLIHQHRRQYPEATLRFEKAIAISVAEIDAHYQLGRIAREQGRHADAIRHFEPVVARDPKHSRHEVWREVGATYVEASDFENARAMLSRYVENRPYDPEGLFLLGLAQKKLGHPEAAREMRERCIEASRTAPDYRKSELRHWRRRAQNEL
jgi:tetratricopeptide (TPR) repeat protein